MREMQHNLSNFEKVIILESCHQKLKYGKLAIRSLPLLQKKTTNILRILSI
jgi:hypothetical protein